MSRFDDDVYARARKFVEDNERRAGEGLANEETPTPRPAMGRRPAAPAPARDENYGNEGRRTPAAPMASGRAEIPRGDDVAPAATGVEQESDMSRNLGAIGVGLGGLGALGVMGRAAGNSRRALETAREAMKSRAGLADAARSGIAANRSQPARSTAGVVEDVQSALKEVPRRAAASKSNKKAANEMASARRRARTKDDSEAGIEFAKGGSVRGWGSARGARKAKIY